jgi:integrase
LSKQTTLTLVQLTLTTGERLPCLVYTNTWLPVKLATRWAVTRRLRVQSSTLRDNLYTIRKLYQWAGEVAQLDLEALLSSGRTLSSAQLESLFASLRHTPISRKSPVCSPNTVNKQLYVLETFLHWTLHHVRPASERLNFTERQAQHEQMHAAFQSLHDNGHPAQRIEPLDEQQIAAIRSRLAPLVQPKGNLQFPTTFTASNALRNWLMVEVALELGLRIGELLKLRLDSLPRGGRRMLLVRRFPDDPYDQRQHEPAVKTAERALPVSVSLASALHLYVTSSPPLGRKVGRTPYLFVTDEGNALSRARANDILEVVSRQSRVAPLSWHRFRHTWAERLAEHLLEVPNGLDQLMYLGGWTNPDSPRRYMQYAVARHAQTSLSRWQQSLYEQEAHS